MQFLGGIAQVIAGVFGLVVVSSLLFNYDFMPEFLESLNSLIGFFGLLIFITLLTGDR